MTDAELHLRLYVAGDLPNSRRAITNLRSYCRDRLDLPHRLEVLDVLEVPDRALEDRVFLTPQLVVTRGRQIRTLIGDLADLDALHQALAADGSEP